MFGSRAGPRLKEGKSCEKKVQFLSWHEASWTRVETKTNGTRIDTNIEIVDVGDRIGEIGELDKKIFCRDLLREREREREREDVSTMLGKVIPMEGRNLVLELGRNKQVVRASETSS